jgi:hypothetical protein
MEATPLGMGDRIFGRSHLREGNSLILVNGDLTEQLQQLELLIDNLLGNLNPVRLRKSTTHEQVISLYLDPPTMA